MQPEDESLDESFEVKVLIRFHFKVKLFNTELFWICFAFYFLSIFKFIKIFPNFFNHNLQAVAKANISWHFSPSSLCNEHGNQADISKSSSFSSFFNFLKF